MNDEHKHFVGEVAQKAIIVNDDKVLFVKNVGNDKWDFPGGRLHTDETPAEGLAREIAEEVGLTAVIAQPLLIAPIYHESFKNPRCFIFFEATISGNTNITLSDPEIETAQWISLQEAMNVDTWPKWKEALKIFLAQRS